MLTQELLKTLLSKATPEERALFDGLDEQEQRLALDMIDKQISDDHDISQNLLWDVDYWTKPVDIETFIEDEYYTGEIGKYLFPTWKEELKTVLAPTSMVLEWILTGSIGGGKTHSGTFAILYKLYQICCMRNPHDAFGLTPGSEIVFGFYTRTRELNESQGFRSLKQWIKMSPFFREHFLKMRGQQELIQLPHSIVLHSGSQMAHALGQNLFAYEIDEMNFMRDKSEESEDDSQAFELYDGTMRRLKSRFLKAGIVPGLVVLISSKRATTDFLEDHKEEKKHDPNAHISDFALYEAKPSDQYSSVTFKVDVGDAYHSPKIVEDGDVIRKEAKIIEVPIDFITDFERNMPKALRDIAGQATDAITPLIPRKEAVYECIDHDRQNPFTQSKVEISTEYAEIQVDRYFDIRNMCRVSRSQWIPKLNPSAPRYLHVDLARTGCSAGIAMGHVSHYVWIEEHNVHDETKSRVLKPIIHIDFMLELPPPRVGEIDFEKIRAFVMKLDALGFFLYRITYDGYQSADSIQLFRKSGWSGGIKNKASDILGATAHLRMKGKFANVLSLDRTDEAYVYLRNAILEDRISYPEYDIFTKEVIALEHDIKKGKVDHPAKGSKDISDCVAGVVYHCMTLRQERPSPPPATPEDVEQYAKAVAAPGMLKDKPPKGVPPRWDITQDYKDRKKLVRYEGQAGILIDPNIQKQK